MEENDPHPDLVQLVTAVYRDAWEAHHQPVAPSRALPLADLDFATFDTPPTLGPRVHHTALPVHAGSAETAVTTCDVPTLSQASPGEWARAVSEARLYSVAGAENVAPYGFTTFAEVSTSAVCNDTLDHRPNLDGDNFNEEAYLDEFDDVAWEQPAHDPAVDVPAVNALDTLRRRGLRDDEIDAAGVLPLPCDKIARIADERPDVPAIAPAVDEQRLTDEAQMCPLCYTFGCVQHMIIGDDMEMPGPSVRKRSVWDGFGAFRKPRTPCSPTCWTAEDRAGIRLDMVDAVVEDLELVDWSDPRAICLLSSVTGLLCSEVGLIIRDQLPMGLALPDQTRSAATASGHTSTRLASHGDQSKLKPRRRYLDAFEGACQHDGPCIEATCSCVRDGYFCERDCSCPGGCAQLFKGCQCLGTAKSGCQQAGERGCPCFTASRECDPLLCRDCHDGHSGAGHWSDNGRFVRSKAAQRTCDNMDVVSGAAVRVRVGKSGIAGYGVFLKQNVEPGQFLMFYTGELIDEDESMRRDVIAAATNRNYMFEVYRTPDLLLDAAGWGNVSRFINTRSLVDKSAVNNCYCRNKRVMGEDRVCIFASAALRAGAELFLSYGDLYVKASK